MSRAAMDLLARPTSWPGNVRELVNTVERAVSFAEGELIEPRDLPETVRGEEPAPRRRRGGSSGPMHRRLGRRRRDVQGRQGALGLDASSATTS